MTAAVGPDDLTVLVLTYRRRKEVVACVASLAAQTAAPHEILVVDNGSEPGTHEEILAVCSTARIVSTPTNLGCPAGRNFGMRLATTPWVVLVDDDATAPPDMIEQALGAMTRWPDAVVIGGAARDHIHDAPEDQAEGPANGFTGFCAALHRTTFLDVGGFPEDGLRQGEERDLCLRLIDAGRQVVTVPSLWVWHDLQYAPGQLAHIARNTTRQDIVTIARYAPLWLAVPLAVAQTARNLLFELRRGQLRSGLAGVGDGVRSLPQVWGTRRPLRARTFVKVAVPPLRRLLRRASSGTVASPP